MLSERDQTVKLKFRTFSETDPNPYRREQHSGKLFPSAEVQIRSQFQTNATLSRGKAGCTRVCKQELAITLLVRRHGTARKAPVLSVSCRQLIALFIRRACNMQHGGSECRWRSVCSPSSSANQRPGINAALRLDRPPLKASTNRPTRRAGRHMSAHVGPRWPPRATRSDIYNPQGGLAAVNGYRVKDRIFTHPCVIRYSTSAVYAFACGRRSILSGSVAIYYVLPVL